MTEDEFFPYHNRHIVFRLRNGDELSGVLIDSMNSDQTGKPRTLYKFIRTSDLMEWKRAEELSEHDRKKSLESDLDLMDITWAQRLNY